MLIILILFLISVFRNPTVGEKIDYVNIKAKMCRARKDSIPPIPASITEFSEVWQNYLAAEDVYKGHFSAGTESGIICSETSLLGALSHATTIIVMRNYLVIIT